MTPRARPSGSRSPRGSAGALTRAAAPLSCGLISLVGVVLLLTGLATHHGAVATVGKLGIVLGGVLLLAFSLLSRRRVERRR